jgi:tricorn protease-like protein/C-terminal processing protease CtpA/Prc
MASSWTRTKRLALFLPLLSVSAAPLAAQPAAGPGKIHAGLLRYPCVSAKEIAFVYANKLWIVPKDGGTALPLATPPGRVMLPKFNAAGTMIAFTGNYDGNPDLYTIPTEGGQAFRVTHHPAAETLCNWSPDNKLIFASNGLAGQARQDQLFVVPPKGGLPEKLPVPYGDDAAVSADGRYLAYTPSTTDFRTWKRYRGGWAQDIWVLDLQTKSAKKITDWEGTDTLPMWQGSTIYYLSDMGPEHRLNLWRYDTKNGQRAQVTRLADYDVKWPSIGPGPNGTGEIVFQYGPTLELLNLATKQMRAVEVRIPGDQSETRPHSVDVSKFVADYCISPSGKHVAIEARGDIWTAPVKDGTPKNLTHSNGVAERTPAWSPDGRWLAYLSDATGEYEIYLKQSDGKGETRQLTKGGSAYRYNVNWSPNSKMLSFSDKTGTLFLVDAATGLIKEIDHNPTSNPVVGTWSPDSRWITYTRSDNTNINLRSIYIYSVETGMAKQVTNGMFNDSQPTFDHKGDYLFFASSRKFQPMYDDFRSSWIYNNSQVLIAMPLRSDVASPFLPKTEAEPFGDEKKDDKKAQQIGVEAGAETGAIAADDPVSGDWKGTAGPISFTFHLTLNAGNTVSGTVTSEQGDGSISGKYDPAKKELTLTLTIVDGPVVTVVATIDGAKLTGTANAPNMTLALQAERVGGAGGGAATGQAGASKSAPVAKPVRVAIDFDGLEARSIQLPVRPGNFGSLAVNDRNQLIFVRQASPGTEAEAGIKLYDLADEKKQEQSVATGAGSFDISPDGKKLLVVRGNSATVQDAGVGGASETVVNTGMNATIDPRTEWKQLFEDAWRIERDFFYDPTMHGVNWKNVHDQYAKMLGACANRDDVGYVIGEMISELNVGHAYYGGGDVPQEPSVSVGMLGADYALQDNAYRITKIYSGAPWDVDARGPLSQPGVKVKTGDYLLAVNGTPMDTTQDPWAPFVGLAGRVVSITVSDKPKLDSSARDVTVRLESSERNIRYRAWIERNRAYVAEKTGGRVGYIYVPSTGVDGQDDLFRQFIGQIGKEALIIDERWNSGGQIPDRFIELLNRPVSNYYARRDGKDWAWPPVSHQGPKCMLINGLAGSGGDCFPWLFRNSKLGKLIGTRTWGGLVGLSGNPALIDGGSVTAPTFAFYKTDGTWGVEGHGVDPDIEVVDDPSLMLQGGDPQLDAGSKEMLYELKRAP